MDVKRQAADVVVSHVSPPRPKRPKLEGPEVVDAEPLRCSTPQPVEGESGEEENGEEDLDATLGISHENIGQFFENATITIDNIAPLRSYIIYAITA